MIKELRKHVVITGCTRGLGRALVNSFYEKGWIVSGCATNHVLIEQMNSSALHNSRYDVVNVTKWDEVSAWSERVIHDFGAPDILLNNAAIINTNANLWEVSVNEFSQLIDINIKGVFYVCKVFIPAMISRQQGVVLNLSSGWGRSTSAEVAPYCASKFAIEGLTLALSQELPEGMAAIPINPGVINTEMLQKCFATGAKNYPSADQWSRSVIDDILSLGPKQNGVSLSLPLTHN